MQILSTKIFGVLFGLPAGLVSTNSIRATIISRTPYNLSCFLSCLNAEKKDYSRKLSGCRIFFASVLILRKSASNLKFWFGPSKSICLFFCYISSSIVLLKVTLVCALLHRCTLPWHIKGYRYDWALSCLCSTVLHECYYVFSFYCWYTLVYLASWVWN